MTTTSRSTSEAKVGKWQIAQPLVLSIDPGSTESAYLLYDPNKKRIEAHGKEPNMYFMGYLIGHRSIPTVLVIEDMQSFGMPVGREVFETVRWTGRFDATWHGETVYIPRTEVKLAICKSMKANDASIRKALIDMFGGPQTTKKGGPLYKVKGDEWSALALAVTHSLKG